MVLSLYAREGLRFTKMYDIILNKNIFFTYFGVFMKGKKLLIGLLSALCIASSSVALQV